jgi:hypothetical protein
VHTEQLVKGLKWGLRAVRTWAANGKVEVLCKLVTCEKVPTENSICGSSLGTFSFSQSPVSCGQKQVGVQELSTDVGPFW